MKVKKLLIIILVIVAFAESHAQIDQELWKSGMEKIILQTDRDVYITGEEIWFRADYYTYIESFENDLSKSLYIELVTPLGESVARQKYNIVDGLVTGKYPVPEGLLTATYLMRAYTQYQRNYPKEHITTNLITIINPSVPLTGYEDKVKWNVKVITQGKGIVSNEISGVAIHVHPKMVSKVSNLKVIDQFDNEIAEVKLHENGLGYAEFYVKDSVAYNVSVIMKNGNVISQEIPKMNRRIFLEKEMVDSSLKLKLSVPENITENEYSVHIYDGFLTHLLDQKIVANGEWQHVELDKSEHGFSLLYLVFKDSENEILQIDALYQLPEIPQPIGVKTSSKNYNTRTEVDVTFTSAGDDFESYSVSVVKKGTFENERTLIPEFIIENPQLLISFVDNRVINNDDFADQLKAVLLIYKSRLLSDPKPLFETNNQEPDNYVAPETRGITIRGVVRNIQSVKPEPKCDVYTAIIGDEPQLHVYTTNEDGEFIFTLKHITGVQNLFLCVDSENENDLEIMVNSDFVDSYNSFYTTPILLDTSMRMFIEDLFVNAQLNAYVSAHDSISISERKYKPIRFPESSTSILVDDYIALPTLRDVINEIVPFVKVQKKKDVYSLEVFDPVTSQLYGDPLILIDNLPVFNVNELLKINPEIVKKISVINSSYLYGEHLFRGIVFFETNTNNFAGVELPVSSTFLEFQALEEIEKYRTDDYSESTERMPDFRNVLYWNPDVSLLNGIGEVSFTTSDYEGVYEVVIRGVNESGKFGLGTANFTVKE